MTIEGGAVRGFDVGVLVVGASENRSAESVGEHQLRDDRRRIDRSRIDHNSSVSDGASGIVMFRTRATAD